MYTNAVDPGWVPTKMGGLGTPDDLEKGFETQVWLAVSEDDKAKVSGSYFYQMKKADSHPQADSIELQNEFFTICQHKSGVKFIE
jgi:hypothetical protein